MKNNFIFMCLAISMLSNGFYNDAFAMSATEQTAERQVRILTRQDANRLIKEMEARGSTELVIPEEYTSIADGAFYGCTGLMSITIPDSVTSIGNHAFSECEKLNTLTIGKNVKTIGDGAFSQCISLTNVTIPSSVMYIGYGAFDGCKKTNFIVPYTNMKNTLLSTSDIGTSFGLFRIKVSSTDNNANAWIWQDNGKITIPNNVTRIDDTMFQNRKDIKSIEISDSVKSIHPKAFNECKNAKFIVPYYAMKSYLILHGINENRIQVAKQPNEANKWAWPTDGNMIIPDMVTDLTDNMFENRDDIKSVVIPNSVQSIGKNIFKECHELKTMIIDAKTISSLAFSNLPKLEELTIGTNVETIGESAFDSCLELRYVTMQNGVKYIGPKALKNSDIYRLSIPDSVISIGDEAFSCRDGIGDLTIGKNVKTIGKRAFCFDKDSCEIVIPDNIQSIVKDVFSSLCSKKAKLHVTSQSMVNELHNAGIKGSVYLNKTLTSPRNNWEVLEPGKIKVLIPHIYSEMFKERKDIKSVVLSDCVISIGNNAFEGCDNLRDVIIGENVKTIGDDAFSHCKNLHNVTIGKNVEVIGCRAFWFCHYLGKVTIPDSVKSIGMYAFDDCYYLTLIVPYKGMAEYLKKKYRIKYNDNDVNQANEWAWPKNGELVIPNTVTNISNNMFAFRDDIKSVFIPNSVTSIGCEAFFLCKSFEKVIIENNVQTIGSYAFACCDLLKEVYIPDSIQDIANNAFHKSSSKFYVTSEETKNKLHDAGIDNSRILINGKNADTDNIWKWPDNGKIIIPDSITLIDDRMFAGRPDITSVVIPDNVTSIGKEAFAKCPKLKHVNIGKNVKTIGYGAFGLSLELEAITIPCGIDHIGRDAFHVGTNLKSIDVKCNNDTSDIEMDKVINEIRNGFTPYFYSSNQTSFIPDHVVIRFINENGEPIRPYCK